MGFFQEKRTPRSLYKYVSSDRWDVIQNLQIRFTQFADLNDPFETQNIRNITEVQRLDWYENLVRGPGYTPYNPMAGWRPEKLLELEVERRDEELEREEYIQNALPALGILSLSERPDNLLLWAHYSQNHYGLVIEFDASHEFFMNTYTPIKWFRKHDTLFRMTAVKYGKNLPVLRSVSAEKSLEKIVFTKSRHWSYEREWRLCRPIAEAHRVFDRHPFPVGLFSIPASAIRGVYFGCRMTKDQVEHYLGRVIRDKPYQHVNYYSAVLDRKTFTLHFRILSR